MKKMFFLIIAVIGITTAWSQHNAKQKQIDTISIDAMSGHISMPNSLKEGRLCMIRIKNVNPLATKSDIKLEAHQLSFDIPPEIKSSIPEKAPSQSDSTKKLLEYMMMEDNILPENIEQRFLSELDRFSDAVDHLNNFLAMDTILRDLLGTCLAQHDSMEKIIKAYFKTQTMNTAFAVGLKDSIPLYYREIGTAFRSLKAAYNKLQRVKPEESKKYELKGEIFIPTAKGKKLDTQKIDGIIEEKKESPKHPYEKEFASAEKLFEKIMEKENVQASQAIGGEITKKVLLFKNTCFDQYSGSYDVREDYFVLEGKVTDKNGKTVYEMPQKIKVPIRGGVRWNFSVGTSIEWGNARGRKYKFDNTDTTVTIREFNNRNIFSPFPLGLVHVYYRFNTWITPAVSFGILPNLTDLEESRYRIGLSALVGNENRIIISIGWSGGKTEWIKPGFEKDQSYQKETWQFKEIKSKSFVSDDFTEKVFKSGFFFGITYNISKTNSESGNK